MSGFLLVNPASGRDSPTASQLAGRAANLGIETHVLREGEDAGAIVAQAEADTLGVAGGDGSLAAVADAALRRDTAFVCVPFGTRNHFARDLGLDPGDPLDALRAFEGGERRIDVGRANGRIFLNNVSFGVYAKLVHRREHHRRRREALARVRAWGIVLAHRRPEEFTIGGETVAARLVLVGNNAYSLKLPSLGARPRLDEGKLHLYVPGGEPPEREGERFVIGSAAKSLDAAVDGEPVRFGTPVELTIEPRRLRVRMPERD